MLTSELIRHRYRDLVTGRPIPWEWYMCMASLVDRRDWFAAACALDVVVDDAGDLGSP